MFITGKKIGILFPINLLTWIWDNHSSEARGKTIKSNEIGILVFIFWKLLKNCWKTAELPLITDARVLTWRHSNEPMLTF